MSLIQDFNSEEQIECAICFEEIGSSNNCVTPCGHKFCFNCIVKSTRQNNSCPCCRGPLGEPIPDNEDDYEEGEEEGEFEEGEDEHNHNLTFGRVIDDIYHLPVTINSIEELSYILEEQGVNSENTETWTRVIIGMFMKDDEDEFKSEDNAEIVNEMYLNDIKEIEVMIEKAFQIFKKSLFLKKHFKKMIFHQKIKINNEIMLEKNNYILPKNGENGNIFIVV
jgi:hypothetical protein